MQIQTWVPSYLHFPCKTCRAKVGEMCTTPTARGLGKNLRSTQREVRRQPHKSRRSAGDAWDALRRLGDAQ